MRGSFSTAGIPYSAQHGLVDIGPRRYETSDMDRFDTAFPMPQAQSDRRRRAPFHQLTNAPSTITNR